MILVKTGVAGVTPFPYRILFADKIWFVFIGNIVSSYSKLVLIGIIYGAIYGTALDRDSADRLSCRRYRICRISGPENEIDLLDIRDGFIFRELLIKRIYIYLP
jgi:hypothetical protein